MKYLDEYRDAGIARAIARPVSRAVTRPWVLMEICGGQTHTIMRYGLEELLPPEIELVHGPGCPVCVTPLEIVDKALAIASRPGVIFVSYGDMLRVPGSHSDLFRVKAAGGDVRIAYSPMDAVKLARENPDRAGGLLRDRIRDHRARQRHGGVAGQARRAAAIFPCWSSHVLVPPAMRADSGVARQPRAGIHRAGPRLHGDGLSRIRRA